MKRATARQRIGAIRRAAKSGDYETAHKLEDLLRFDVLMAIANREIEYPDELAAMAASTTQIPFLRVRA